MMSAFFGCRHIDVITVEEKQLEEKEIPPAPVLDSRPKVKKQQPDVIMYKGHEYVVYAVHGMNVGITHSPECHCVRKTKNQE